MNLRSTSSFVVMLFGSACLLSACGPKEPPPDVLKTQREALEKAKQVEKTIMKADQDGRKQTDEASK